MATEKTRVPFRATGKSLLRFDGEEKVKGETLYADDIKTPGLWHGYVVRTEVPHGRLTSLEFDPAFDWDSVCVVTAEDIPGENVVDMWNKDMPFIADDVIQHLGEPVALVAAPTLKLAKEAARHIRQHVEEAKPILTLEEVVAQYKTDPSALHEQWAQTIRKGDVDAALESADEIVTGEYWCGHQEQMYIEPQTMTVVPEEDGSLFIHGSMQCPYYINPELCITLGLPPEKLRVKQTAVGGAFGGKEEFPTFIAGYCALLAMKSGKPVRIVYDRHQDILFSTKRHPAWTRHVTGLNRDGSIQAMKIQFLLDGGAYTTISPVVLFRGILHAALGYRCENVAIDGHVYRTNTYPNGAFRGFGAPQSIWGLESHIDRLAEVCGQEPHTFRLNNALKEGDTTPTGQVLKDSLGTPHVLVRNLEKSGFAEKYAHASRGNPDLDKWYGIGLSFFGHGSGFTGDGEAKIKARVALDLDFLEDGDPGVNCRVSSTEMGQGSMTVLAQQAADGLNLDIGRVKVPFADTFLVPNSGPTVASRTTMVVGSTLYGAGVELKDKLCAYAAREFFNGTEAVFESDEFKPAWGGGGYSFREVASRYLKQHGSLRVYNQFDLPSSIRWNQDTFEGDAYPAYSWGSNIAEVEVDPLTLEFKVSRVTAVYDIGRVINPLLAKGQIEGGLVQCLGYAVMEKIRIKDGKYDANRMQTYVIPTMMDKPEFDLEFMEFPYEHAWPGAKGVGEIPMDGLAPAIANALYQAVGKRFPRIPITPEDIFEAVQKGQLNSV